VPLAPGLQPLGRPGRHAAGLRIIVSGDRRTAVGMGGGAPGRGYHGHLSAQVVRQSRQALVLALRSAILDRHAPALDVTRFAQALTERGRKVREDAGEALLRNPTTDIAGGCARAANGAVTSALPRSDMSSRRFIDRLVNLGLPACDGSAETTPPERVGLSGGRRETSSWASLAGLAAAR